MLRYVIPCEWILCWGFPNSSIRSLSEAFACQAQSEHIQFAACLLRGEIALCGKWVGPNWRDCLLTSAYVSAAQWSAIANSYLRGNRSPNWERQNDVGGNNVFACACPWKGISLINHALLDLQHGFRTDNIADRSVNLSCCSPELQD